MIKFAKRVGAGVVTAVVLVACAAAPTQEMSDARQSVQAAREAGAETYAAQNLSNARDYLEQAERELELRYFSRARHDAIVARSEAVKARNVALALKAAETALEQAAARHPDLEEARALLGDAREAARQGKDRKAVRLAEQARRKVQLAADPE